MLCNSTDCYIENYTGSYEDNNPQESDRPWTIGGKLIVTGVTLGCALILVLCTFGIKTLYKKCWSKKISNDFDNTETNLIGLARILEEWEESDVGTPPPPRYSTLELNVDEELPSYQSSLLLNGIYNNVDNHSLSYSSHQSTPLVAEVVIDTTTTL